MACLNTQYGDDFLLLGAPKSNSLSIAVILVVASVIVACQAI